MRALNILSTVGTTTLDLGNVEFLSAGEILWIAGADSVATATLSVQFGAVDVFSGPLPIESVTDHISYQQDLLTYFRAPRNGKVIATLGGTVAGARTNFLVQGTGEPKPF